LINHYLFNKENLNTACTSIVMFNALSTLDYPAGSYK